MKPIKLKWRIALHNNEQTLLQPGDKLEGVLLLEDTETICKEVHVKTTFIGPDGKAHPHFDRPDVQASAVIGQAENFRKQLYGARQ